MKNYRSLIIIGLALVLAAFGVQAEPIDINTATAEQIAVSMVGVGKAKAEAIVMDREKNGNFKSVDDLARVKGVKAATIAKNRDKISVGAATNQKVSEPVNSEKSAVAPIN